MTGPELAPLCAGVILDRDGVRVHTCTAPEEFLENSSHIIETADALVLIDAQFVVPYAREFRRYADGLGKPIERLYLSHAHVDHFFGVAAAFADVPVHAAAPTIATLERDGENLRAQRAAQYGPLVPDRVVIPQHTAAPGVDVIDGVKYEIEVVTGAECDAQLLITLPDLGVVVAQDLVYSGAHAYLVPDPRNWIAVLERLAGAPAGTFLAGHGPVADAAELRRFIGYLTFAQRTFERETDPAAFTAALRAEYPDRTCAALLDICAPHLYPAGGKR